MKYFELSPEENTFETIMVDLTHRCNMECSNCYIPNRDIPDMDKDKLYEFIARLPARTYIRLIGAEPTMRSDLCEIIKKVKELGHRVSLTTNGLKLKSEAYTKKLKEAGLNLVLISMNGADDDDVYQVIDNGRYAKAKRQALDNCLQENMIVNTGTIIVKGVNEHVIERQLALFSGVKSKIKPVLRFRTIGKIGRYMDSSDFQFKDDEFIELFHKRLGVSKDLLVSASSNIKNNTSGLVFEHENVYIRLVDWRVDEYGVPDAGNHGRGRITKDWTIAPFFEDVKQNEFGY